MHFTVCSSNFNLIRLEKQEIIWLINTKIQTGDNIQPYLPFKKDLSN